jgi:DNA-binding winged helix-turn-helix (wHTH) protein
LDEEAGRVFVGGREIDLATIPTKAYDMLRYLYKRGEEVVSKAELYYLGYCGLKRVPVIGENHWEEPDSYEGTIDTNLWRLRKAIEPAPSHPVLLETVRRYGIRLHVRW